MAFVALAFAASCRSKSDMRAACPPEQVIELLHDAVFHLDQRDDDARVRRDLDAVRTGVTGTGPAEVWAHGFAGRIDAALHSNGGNRQLEAETLRADLHTAVCLPKDLHQRFHSRMPPLHPSKRDRP